MLDKTDRMLLSLLKEDSRRKYSELGEAVHLSSPAVYERVKKLERSGVIRRYTIDINSEALGLGLAAFVRIQIGHVPCEEMASALQRYPQVEECYSSAGEESMILKVRTPTPSTLETFLDSIRQLPGVERLQTSIILTTNFERANIPSSE